jgi:recombinational DNA repair protein (RecF pathway)
MFFSFTCCNCEHSCVDGISGDVDERTCYKCLDADWEEDEKKSKAASNLISLLNNKLNKAASLANKIDKDDDSDFMRIFFKEYIKTFSKKGILKSKKSCKDKNVKVELDNLLNTLKKYGD